MPCIKDSKKPSILMCQKVEVNSTPSTQCSTNKILFFFPVPKVFDLISFFLPKCRTENLWKWTSLSMVHLNDWRRPQARFPPHRHNLMLTSPTSLRIAAAKAIVVKRYLPTSILCSTILNKSNFTVLADRVQINRKQD